MISLQPLKRADQKSHCPVNFALETFGDAWSLLIVRDIVFFGKRTYTEFLNSGERISTNILSRRLVHLERNGIIFRTPDNRDNRRDLFGLTEKGLAVIPFLLEMAGWAARSDERTTAPMEFVNSVYSDRDNMYNAISEHIRGGGSLFGERPFYRPDLKLSNDQ